MAKTTSKKLAEFLEKQKQLQAQIQVLKQRENAVERKKDTRRKILIGGAVLAKIKRGEWPYQQLVDLLDEALTLERDRALFDLPPQPTVGGTLSGSVVGNKNDLV